MLYAWQAPYIDNVIYRDVETVIPIAVSRVPDIVVSSANDDPEKIKRAQKTQSVLNFNTKSRYMRDVLRKMGRHEMLDFVGIIKPRWDRVKQMPIVEAVSPKKVILDHTASPNAYGMSSESFDFIGELL